MVHRILVGRLLGCGAAALFVLGFAPHAGAFCRTTICGATKNLPPECGDRRTLRDPVTDCLTRGAPLAWEQGCISFGVQQLGSELLPFDFETLDGIVSQGFAAWEAASCQEGPPSIHAINLGALECDRREFNSTGPNNNGIFFVDADWPHKRDAIALTTVSFDSATGKIFGADMEINTENFPLSPVTLEAVITHEAGHFFGLDHSPVGDAVMFSEYPVYENEAAGLRAALTPDDTAAICDVYPPDRDVSALCEPEPEHGYATDCGGNVFGSCSVMAGGLRRPSVPGHLALGAALVIGLIRRRRSGRARKLLVVPQERV